MATRGALAAAGAKTLRPRPVERPERPSSPDLGVLDRRQVVARARRRQARVLTALAAALVAGPLTLASLGHAFVAAQQVRSDSLQAQIAQALQVQQDYQLQKAELVAPTRILAIAETRLHMVTPSAVTYLRPVNPGETVAQAHEASTAAPPLRHGARRGAGGDGSSSGSTTASPPAP
ncbi:MAG TPA: hypothetical protein VEH29_02610 [Acidimicrobiales bacterium]|nr:hypothetical protein [Acidimicrobiales bacterium]